MLINLGLNAPAPDAPDENKSGSHPHESRHSNRHSFRTSDFGSPKRPTIDDWEIGEMFGVPVIRGIVDGRRVTVRILWGANNRFGISRASKGTEEVWKVGRSSEGA